jgi:hypothetical protein
VRVVNFLDEENEAALTVAKTQDSRPMVQIQGPSLRQVTQLLIFGNRQKGKTSLFGLLLLFLEIVMFCDIAHKHGQKEINQGAKD